MINRQQINKQINKFQQTCRTKLQANNNLENIYVSRTSLRANIFTKFTRLAELNHVQAGHEAGCFNRDLARSR